MLQPPDPEDLRRYPPADESCLRIRGLLRDYADGELEPALRAAVDLHVHGCRACALALSRAEHEVWRLRRALAGESVAGAAAGAAAGSAESAGVPRGFPGRTVERLVRELSRATPSPAVLPVQPSAGAGSSVAGSSGTGSSVTSCNGAASRAFRMRRLLGYCTVVGAALAAMSLLLWRGYAEVDRTARAVVVAAEYARFGNGSQSVPAVPGEVLTEGATPNSSGTTRNRGGSRRRRCCCRAVRRSGSSRPGRCWSMARSRSTRSAAWSSPRRTARRSNSGTVCTTSTWSTIGNSTRHCARSAAICGCGWKYRPVTRPESC